MPADPVVDVALRRSHADHHRVCGDGRAARRRARCYRVANDGSRAARRAPLRRAAPVPGVRRRGRRSRASAAPPRSATLAWRDGAVLVNGATRVVPRSAPSGFGAAAFEQGGVCAISARGVLPPHRRSSMPSATRPARCAWTSTSPPAAAREVELAVPFAEPSRPRARVDRPDARRPTSRRLGDVERHWAAQARRRARSQIGGAEPACVRDAAHRHRAHPGQPRRPGAPARAAALHALLDPRRRDHGGGAAAHGLRRRGARLRALVRDATRPPTATCRAPWTATAPTGCRARQPRPARLHARRVLPLHRRPRLPRGAVARRAARRRLPRVAAARHAARPEFSTRRAARVLRPPAGVGEPRGLSRAAGARLLGRLLGAARHRRRRGARARARRRARGGAPRARCATSSAQCLYESIDATIADARARLRPRLGRVGRLRSRRRPPPRSRPPMPPSACRPARSHGPSTSTCAAFAGGGAARSTGTTTPPTRSASSARWCASGGAPTRTSCSTSSSPTAARGPGTSGPRSPGATRGAPGISATSRMRGSAPSTCWRCSACSRTSARADDALVIAAGISESWLDKREVVVDGLPTWWGPLGYSLRRDGPDALRFEFTPGLAMPPGGIVVRPPLARPLVAVASRRNSRTRSSTPMA